MNTLPHYLIGNLIGTIDYTLLYGLTMDKENALSSGADLNISTWGRKGYLWGGKA